MTSRTLLHVPTLPEFFGFGVPARMGLAPRRAALTPLPARMLARTLAWKRLLGLICLTACCWITPLRAEAECSLVVNGSISDLDCFRDPAVGLLVSARVLEKVAGTATDIRLESRPDKGLIVLTWPGKKGATTPLTGFTSASIQLLVNGSPLFVRYQLRAGTPFLESSSLHEVLEKLGYNVLIAPDTGLISIFRLKDTAPEAASDAGEAHAPGAGMLEAVQAGSARSLQGMGDTGAVDMAALERAVTLKVSPKTNSATSPPITVTERSSGDVCASMDRLRTLWEETEPSAKEKETFKRLAKVFQEAQDTKGKLDPAEVDELYTTLEGFHKKVKRRLTTTRSWSSPDAARRVKLYGEDFLISVDEVMTLSSTMMKAIKDNDKEFAKRGQEDIDRLKELEASVQTQGQRFDAEVTKVRSSFGCGPAKRGLGPS